MDDAAKVWCEGQAVGIQLRKAPRGNEYVCIDRSPGKGVGGLEIGRRNGGDMSKFIQCRACLEPG